MKPNVQEDLLDSNIQSDYEFSIKESAQAFQILSNNLYSDKILAVVREYLTNALDAQIASGVKTPFSVTLPSNNELLGNNYWQVRDYGTGLSEEDIKEFYCTYFSSSKQSSNDFTGMLGLGCKSAFAYTHEFLISSWFKGTKTDYFIFIENGLPKLTKLGSKPSDEPSGLKVSIYVKPSDAKEFIETTKQVLKWFPQEYVPTILKSDVEPEYETDNLKIVREQCKYANFYCLMGNVLYPVDNDEFESKLIYKIQGAGYKVVLKFPIGSLSILPSREGLSLDENTKKAIHKKINIATNELNYKKKQDSSKKLFDSTKKIGNVFFMEKAKLKKDWDTRHYIQYVRVDAAKAPYCTLSRIYSYILDTLRIGDKNYFVVVPSNTKVPITTLKKFANENNIYVLSYKCTSDKKIIYKFLRKFYSGKIYSNFKDFIKDKNIKKPKSVSNTYTKTYSVTVYEGKSQYASSSCKYVNLTLQELRELDAYVEVNYVFPEILRTFPDILGGKDFYLISPNEIRSNVKLNKDIDYVKYKYFEDLAINKKKEFIHALFVKLFVDNCLKYDKARGNLWKYIDFDSNNDLSNKLLKVLSFHKFAEISEKVFGDKIETAYDEFINELFVSMGLEKVLELLLKKDITIYSNIPRILGITSQQINQHMEKYICKILPSLATQ